MDEVSFGKLKPVFEIKSDANIGNYALKGSNPIVSIKSS